MSKTLLLFPLFAALLFGACNPLDIVEPDTVPKCIEKMLDKEDPQTQAMVIGLVRYERNGSYYFELMPECCDQFTSLYDADCQFVCHPGGGITGAGDGQCPAWVASELTSKKVLWEKP